jgi:hypothetical protein
MCTRGAALSLFVMEKPAPLLLSYSVDWTHRGGTRICAEICIKPGNNETPADIERTFEFFCDDMRDTLLVKQQDDDDIIRFNPQS